MIRRLQVVGGLIGLWILLVNFRRAWHELGDLPSVVSWGRIVVATMLLTVTYGGFAALWRALARELGTNVPYRTTVQFWAFSNLGRYIPGKIWQITGVMLVAADLGVPPVLAATVGALALGFMIATGSLLGFGLLPLSFAADRLRLAAAGLSALGLAIPMAFPGVLRALLLRMPRSMRWGDVPDVTRGGILRLTVLFAAAWIAHGLVFQFFCTAFVPIPWSRFPSITGAFCLSYVAGLVAIFAPGGIGVREELLSNTLGTVLPGAPTHVLAVASRLWMMAAEALVLAVALALRFRATKGLR